MTTALSAQQLAELQKPLNPEYVASRRIAGREVSYVEGWHVIAEANRIFGFDGWHRETVDMVQLGDPQLVKGNWRVGYRAKVRITVGTIVRDGSGFGQGIDRDAQQAHESALKEAETDAMKRALMTFGNPFGLALYDKSFASVASPEAVDAYQELLAEVYACESVDDLSQLGAQESFKQRLADLTPAQTGEVRKAWAKHAKELKRPKSQQQPKQS